MLYEGVSYCTYINNTQRCFILNVAKLLFQLRQPAHAVDVVPVVGAKAFGYRRRKIGGSFLLFSIFNGRCQSRVPG